MRYRFGDCVLALGSRELMRGSNAIVLPPQVFDLLAYLIRNRERVVSKDELIATIWDGRIVSDAALTTRVYAARSAIGDSGSQQLYIKTLARRGLRFVGCVEEIGDAPSDGSATTCSSYRISQPVGPRGPSISVLTFRHTYGERGSEAMGQMMSEEMRIELTRLRWLKVAPAADGATNSSRQVEAAVSRLAEGAQYLLHGSIKRIDGQCRVIAEVVDASNGLNLWGESYDASRTESFTSLRSIAGAIAAEVAAAIVAHERSRALSKKPDDLGAWEAYQLGMWHMSGCDSDTIASAQRYFQQAIALDPHFASGYSALAWAQLMAASIYSNMTIAEGCELGRPLVLRAMTLDQSDPEARARLALIEFLKGDVGGAIEEAEAVLIVKPNCASALGVQGAALISTGRRREGRAAIRKFLSLSPYDPVRPVRLTQVATSYYLDGDYTEAVKIAKQVTRRFPRHPFAYRWLAAALGQLGRIEEANLALQTLRNNWPNSFEMYVMKQPPSYCSTEYKPLLAGLRKAGFPG